MRKSINNTRMQQQRRQVFNNIKQTLHTNENKTYPQQSYTFSPQEKPKST